VSFDKDYPNRKDNREKYRKSQRVDRTCRPGGSCPYCASGRQHKRRVAEERAKEEMEEQSRMKE
jgi:hypothetical protein